MTAPAHPAARDHCLAPSRTSAAPVSARYGRPFPGLPPLRLDPTTLSGASGPGGLCDAGADEPEEPADGREAAGWPFFGQIVAPDITADRSPPSPTEQVDALRNSRRPRLDLEIVYADGPVGMPYLFDTRDPVKLLTGDHGHDRPRNSPGVALTGDHGHNRPRNSPGVALLGDPRNDVHLFVASLHLAMLHAHNGLVDRLRADGVADDDLFEEARRSLTWHCQWIVVHDFLPRVVGPDLTAEVLTEGGRHFTPAPDEAYIPLEFADAAYRYGHSQIRRGYQRRAGGPTRSLFPGCVGFDPIATEHRVSWERDPGSYLRTDPGWRPSLPRAGDAFGLADLLPFAEAVRRDPR